MHAAAKVANSIVLRTGGSSSAQLLNSSYSTLCSKSSGSLIWKKYDDHLQKQRQVAAHCDRFFYDRTAPHQQGVVCRPASGVLWRQKRAGNSENKFAGSSNVSMGALFDIIEAKTEQQSATLMPLLWLRSMQRMDGSWARARPRFSVLPLMQLLCSSTCCT